MKIEDCIVYDIETAQNMTIVGFRDVTGAHEIMVLKDAATDEQIRFIRALGEDKTFVGFNNLGFDTYQLNYIMARGARPIDVFQLGQAIITSKGPGWQVAKSMNANRSGLTEIDLMHFVPRKANLKVLEARMGMDRVVTLPFDPNAPIEDDKVAEVVSYLKHDLDATWMLLEKTFEEIQIRQNLMEITGVGGLLQKPPAGAAEAVVVQTYCRADPEVEPEELKARAARFRDCTYELVIQDWVKDLCKGTRVGELIPQIEGITFDYTGGIQKASRSLPGDIEIGGVHYAMGRGGLHSIDAPGFSRGIGSLLDIDVASYYPSLMLRPGGAPVHLDEDLFHSVFGDIVQRRLEAKAAGRKREASALKLVINSIFGKMGEPFSSLFSPPSFLATTIGGQLSLLALAERISTNTNTNTNTMSEAKS